MYLWNITVIEEGIRENPGLKNYKTLLKVTVKRQKGRLIPPYPQIECKPLPIQIKLLQI